jgi:hypothetical protein
MSTAIFTKVSRPFARSRRSPSRTFAGTRSRRRPSRGLRGYTRAHLRGDALVGGIADRSGIYDGGCLGGPPASGSRAFRALASVGQRLPALPVASVNTLPVNGLVVCQCQRLPAVAPALPASPACQRGQLASPYAGPAGWHWAALPVGQLASPSRCQRPALPAAAAPAVASGRVEAACQRYTRWPVMARSSPVDARTGAAC